MLEPIVAFLLPSMLLGLFASWAFESLLQPRPVPVWQRPIAANLTHMGVWVLAFALELALFRRPYFAMANVLAIELVLILVSRAKFHSLQEPFVFPDFEYFTDAIRHPRLYLPFFGWANAVAAIGGYGVALWLGLTFENAIVVHDHPSFLPTVGLLALGGLALAMGAGRWVRATFDAEPDLRRLGFVGALWAYGRAERQCALSLRARAPFHAVAPDEVSDVLPDLVSIQSESFFDVRRAYPIVKQDVLAGFDRLRAEALVQGELNVAARGANTVRTEFSFLSGMAPSDLGVHRYNPYRRLAGHGLPTLATYLKQLGYRTICVHPYHGDFYRRNRVLPALGFDEFIDLKAFEEAEKVGAYVGDQALGRYVSALLTRDDPRPLFIHVITMENHGPLHWEPVTEADARDVLNGAMPQGCEELVAYARHLRNADAMFSSLRQTLLNNGRPAGMCIFGDHIPIMPKVYRALGGVSGLTEGVIWAVGGSAGEGRRLKVSSLAADFLSGFALMKTVDLEQAKT
ncbi:hypothetical protein LMG1873_01925 [Achromobacter piechaudii]|uniref:Sulfatase N-terminal domain-containing protein n=2 Tax=Achromobacter piechaudii TaxID=72556 RepID=A0A6S7DE01_9BURK|nr:hypothetical protein LMG1873_01925 [Achromobacter piechaudii]CAB3865410.1 hypothetical protein LMG2828_02695 [Achromobacter piechaudii]CAB3871768.1 hypothetical protein LMG1861_02804 [Achromobacter piechaudii]CAB3948973.1 hypothetical protein LMG6103_02045 [Achromobacter piechaudii]